MEERKVSDNHSHTSGESDDEVEEIEIRKQNIKQQRSSVSAECFGIFNKKSDFQPRQINKSEQVKNQIQKRLSQAFMFQALDSSEKEIVVGAMEDKSFKAGEWIINQGEEGEVLYVIESGNLDCSKQYPDKNEPTFLKTYEPGEFFGELALLYNAPRAASIQAKTDCQLFALDRATFNHIVKDAAMRKREQYDTFLKQWSLLSRIEDDYEKCKIADTFQYKTYKAGEVILQKGHTGKDIFILLEGSAQAEDDKKAAVIQYNKKGDYFGEVVAVGASPSQPLNFVASSENTQGVIIPSNSYKSTLIQVESELRTSAAKYSNWIV